MILNIFVHDFSYSVGHSRAMIEVLRNINKERIESINIICFQSDNIKALFPESYQKFNIINVPLNFLFPFLLKSIFYQLYTQFFFRKKGDKKEINITMGICSFVGDIINVQFAHYLWAESYFKLTQNSFIKNIYKKFYFNYLNLCEKSYYSKNELKFVFLSKFMQDSFIKNFKIDSDKTFLAYSSAASNKFRPSPKSRAEVFNGLKEKHSELLSIDHKKPTFLFVGAFERKGLTLTLDKIPNDANYIIIGKPERGSRLQIPSRKNIVHIPHTDNIQKFYQCFDTFVFPTLFEPFGLVIMEAAMCGMNLVISQKNVGASELLKEMEGVHFIDPFLDFSLSEFMKILPDELRQERHEVRKEKLRNYTWKQCAKEWEKAINS